MQLYVGIMHYLASKYIAFSYLHMLAYCLSRRKIFVTVDEMGKLRHMLYLCVCGCTNDKRLRCDDHVR